MVTIRKCSMVAWLVIAALAPMVAQETFRLVSAQVVTRTEGPPSLKLAANGPIAFSVLPPPEGEPAAANKLRARLYGVASADLATSGLAPYVLAVQADGQDTVLTVTAPSNLKIALRAAMKSNEIDVVATVLP
jgi:hypothetical protein